MCINCVYVIYYCIVNIHILKNIYILYCLKLLLLLPRS